MAKGVYIEIKDSEITQFLNKLKETINDKTMAIEQELAANALLIERSAKRLAPVDTGRLRNSISSTKEQFLTYSISAQTKYAAYVEFGTGNYFQPLPEKEWNDLASQFRGRGIKKVNLLPRPYLRPSVLAYIPEITKGINKILKEG